MMGVESTLPPVDHAVLGNSDTEASEVVECDSTAVEVVEKSVNQEARLQVPLGNKQDIESLGTVCDLENNEGDVVADAIILNEVALDIQISCKAPDESISLGCQTPRGNIFDPFAPGLEEVFCGAPKKVVRGVETFSRRKLIFESDDFPVKRLSYEFDDLEEEDVYLQGICKMFLELIVANQALEATADGEAPIDAAIPPESYKTPESMPLLTGIADTCPDAPLRPSLKMLKLSPSICRKLDFGSVSPKALFSEDNKS